MIHLRTSMCRAPAAWPHGRGLAPRALRAWVASQTREGAPHPATRPGDGLHCQPPSLWRALQGWRMSQGFQAWVPEPSTPSTTTSSSLLFNAARPLVSGSTKFHRPLLRTGRSATRPPGGAYLMGTTEHTVAPTRLAQRSVGPRPPP